jgi:hypothetical protein
MSLLKNWKLLLAMASVILLAACAGSKGGSGSSESGSGSGSEEQTVTSYDENGKEIQVKKEEIDENQLKNAQTQATSLTEENHQLRRQIFQEKTDLGIATDSDSDTQSADQAQ